MTSTAADFKRKAETEALEPAEALTLPSGLVVRACRPKPLWWILNRGILPGGLAARAAGQEATDPTADDVVESSGFIVHLMESVVIEPRIRRNPGAGEVDPRWITDDDLTFLIRYAGGETTADGQDLGTFRGRPGSADAGPGGKGMELPAERVD